MTRQEISKHKKYRLIIDTETTGGLNSPIVYDVGFAVVDNTGHIYYSKHYVAYEIFIRRPDLMQTAYYADKIPLYWNKILNRETEIRRFFDIRRELWQLIRLFHITEIGAFNCAFDKKALDNTVAFLWGDEQNFFPKSMNFVCIWHMACQTICKQTGYLKFCKENHFESERGNGNVQTSAEVIYRYLLKNPEYSEVHMGLDDVQIETAIMAKCIKQHKKMNTEINTRCWKIPQEKYRTIGAV